MTALALALLTPTADAGRFDIDGLICIADQVAFDGACRSVDWFDDLGRPGWSIETVVGCDVVGDCDHALLLERKDDGSTLRGVVVAEDTAVASINQRDGYPVIRRVLHTDGGTTLTTKVVEVDGSGSTVVFEGPAGSGYATGGTSSVDALVDWTVGYTEVEWTLKLGGQDFWMRSLGDAQVWILGNFEIQDLM